MCTNYTKIILWNILQVNYKLPTELIIKILYTHKGLQHPLAHMIDNGIAGNVIDLVVSASKGELNINVAKEVAANCCLAFLKSRQKK